MSGYERSKAPLALMEQIIMILVFALASAVCLQAFVYSDNLSRKGMEKETAQNLAGQVTEYCKDNHGDMDAVCGLLSAEKTDEGLRVEYPEDEMTVLVTVSESDDYMEKAKITVLDSEGGEIYSMDAAWQVTSKEEE